MRRLLSRMALTAALPVLLASCAATAGRHEATPTTHTAPRKATPQQPRVDRSKPKWMQLEAGTPAIVDVAPWPGTGAALVSDLRDLERYEDVNVPVARPRSALSIPIGSVVLFDAVVTKIDRGRLVRVHQAGTRRPLYTILSRLLPIAPLDEEFTVPGGLGGYEGMYKSLSAAIDDSVHLASNTRVRLIRRVIASQPQSSDLVWGEVIVENGRHRGEQGYVPAGDLAIPRPTEDSVLHCRCALVSFDD